jgi:adenine phosphoribosyltransferase
MFVNYKSSKGELKLDLKEKIRVIEGFPKEGISFKDVTTLLQDNAALKYTVDTIASYLKDKNIDIIVGPEARGFLFGTPVAYALGAGFVPVRKKGKLPHDTIGINYDLEYGSDELEIHKDAIRPGQRVAIVDDLLATGGTVASVAKLIEQVGGEVVSINFLIELTGLKGIEKLQSYDVTSMVKYEF